MIIVLSGLSVCLIKLSASPSRNVTVTTTATVSAVLAGEEEGFAKVWTGVYGDV